MPFVIRSKTRFQLLDFTLDLLCSGDAHLILDSSLTEIKQRIAVTIDCATVMSFESRTFCELHPVCDFDGRNELADRKFRFIQLGLIRINPVGRIDAIHGPRGSFDLVERACALLGLMK